MGGVHLGMASALYEVEPGRVASNTTLSQMAYGVVPAVMSSYVLNYMVLSATDAA